MDPKARLHHRSNRRRGQPRAAWLSPLLVVLGCALVAYAFCALMRPNRIASGGLPGISLLLEHAFGIAPALSQAVLNLSFLALGWKILGRAFALKSLLGALLLPVFVWLFRDVPALTHDRVLAVLCGGVAIGTGIGLVFRGHGSVGGFSILSIILNRKAGLQVDRSLFAFDAVVVVGAAFLFSADSMLAALVSVFLVGRAARAVLTGFSNSQCALVVSKEASVIRKVVLEELDLGLTKIPSEGGFSGERRDLLMVVMRPADVPRFKAVVSSRDPEAFVVMIEASEVLGYGFKSHHHSV